MYLPIKPSQLSASFKKIMKYENTTLIFNFKILQPKLLGSEPAQKQPSIFSFPPFQKKRMKYETFQNRRIFF